MLGSALGEARQCHAHLRNRLDMHPGEKKMERKKRKRKRKPSFSLSLQ
jgi:hypothetical protein